MSVIKKSLVPMITLVLCSISYAVVDQDHAAMAAYVDGWDRLDDGSLHTAGFGGWVFDEALVIHGHNIGIASASGNGGTGAIDTDGVSFMIHDKTGASVEVFRFFDPAGLVIGESCSIDIDVNFRSGYKGIDIRDAKEGVILNFNIGNDDYVVHKAASGNGSISSGYASDTQFHLTITQANSDGGTWSITRSGAINGFAEGTYSGVAYSLKLYSGDQGTSPEDAMYVNNLSITASH